MKKYISLFILKLLGWKVVGLNSFSKKCLIICAPHTSNWDFLYARCYGYIVGIFVKYLAKSELFFPILGTILKNNGAIPVYRQSKNNLVDQIVQKYKKNNELIIGLSPEGTREKVDKWKTGFYHIAYKSKIPIYLLRIDYFKKEIGVVNYFIPSGNYQKDMLSIKDVFSSLHAKYPSKYNPEIF